MEEIIIELTMSERVLQKENEALKENNLRMKKEFDEWHKKACWIMKKKQTQIDHLHKKNG